MDFRLNTPATFLLTGPSGSGKSTALERILDYAEEMFKDCSFLQFGFVFYKVETDSINKLRQILSKNPRVKKAEFIQGCPTGEQLRTLTEALKYTGSFIVLDDLESQLPKCVVNYFTVYSHHHNSTGFLLTQNLFPNEEHFRKISRNVKHVLVFQNHRDKIQFKCFAKQFDPDNNYLYSAYKEILENHPYSYLWIDICQDTPQSLRVRTNCTPPEWPMRIISPTKKKNK